MVLRNMQGSKHEISVSVGFRIEVGTLSASVRGIGTKGQDKAM